MWKLAPTIGGIEVPAVATVGSTASNDEVLDLIDQRPLRGKGMGWTDAHLLASALLSGCRLWTRDISLHTAAVRMSLAEVE